MRLNGWERIGIVASRPSWGDGYGLALGTSNHSSFANNLFASA